MGDGPWARTRAKSKPPPVLDSPPGRTRSRIKAFAKTCTAGDASQNTTPPHPRPSPSLRLPSASPPPPDYNPSPNESEPDVLWQAARRRPSTAPRNPAARRALDCGVAKSNFPATLVIVMAGLCLLISCFVFTRGHKQYFFGDISPSSSNGPLPREMMAPRSVSVTNSRTNNPVPENNIPLVINSAQRGSSRSPRSFRISLAIDPPMTPTEYVSRSDSFRKNEVHIRIGDVLSQDNFSKAKLDVVASRELSRRGSKVSVGSSRDQQSSTCEDPAEHVSMLTGKERAAKATTYGEFGVTASPTTKTRTYMMDGMQVTSTTLHVLGSKEDMQFRKQQLQDLWRLQREEARQKQELQAEGLALADQQERKFQNEKTAIVRQYELDLEAVDQRQKREIKDAERSQEEELRMAQEKLKFEQEKDLRAFKDRKKQEMKIAKQELDMLPRYQRKEALKIKMEHLEHEKHMMEAELLMLLPKNSDATLVRLAQKHKERIAQLERQFLMQKHLLLRAKEYSDWVLEEKQMGEKYVLHRKLFKDEYFLLRTQMLGRHQKEVGQALKIHQEEEDELSCALTLDRKKLPKMLRHEAKTRNTMFEESLNISMQPMTQSEMAERLRRFEEQENARCKHALDEHDTKSARKVALLKERHFAAIGELNEMLNYENEQLFEKERLTMREHEKKYFEMREQWQTALAPRKLMLESKFQEELEAQERFYGISLHMPLASTSVAPHMC